MTDATGHALYEGTVWHERHSPAHRFTRRVTMALLDLERLDDAHVPPWCGTSRWSPVRIRRDDFIGDASTSPADAARSLVEERLGVRPTGAVRVLTNLRTWGWCFNPITVYWCLDLQGSLVAELLVVTNTPWKEQHTYVLDRRAPESTGSITFGKEMHVSPFLPMDLVYRFRGAVPGDTASLRFDVLGPSPRSEVVFSAGFEGHRRPFDDVGVRRLLWRTPTQRVSLGIHVEAARLWRKGARVHRHPARTAREAR